MQAKSEESLLIILATYWNERYFIKPSLRQIEALNPREVIIADGCFNPGIPNYSTDGTREIIQEFANKHPNVRMVSALRPGFFRSLWLLLRGHRHLPWWTMLRPVRWKFLLVSLLRIAYQRNEGLTFNHMISLSERWKPGMWFMTYDADQFYSDEMIEAIGKLTKEEGDFDLITGEERTFFHDFAHFTEDYEKRGFNNMPHRIYPDTIIQPQRSIIRETKSHGNLFRFKDILAKHLYIRFAKIADAGAYFHYKLNPAERLEAGYQVGNRRKPDPSAFEMKQFTGRHPVVVQEHFGL